MAAGTAAKPQSEGNHMATLADVKMRTSDLLVKVLGFAIDVGRIAAIIAAGPSRKLKLLLQGGMAAILAIAILLAGRSVFGHKTNPPPTMVYATVVKVEPGAGLIRVAKVSNDEERHDLETVRISGQTQTLIDGQPSSVTALRPNQFVAITVENGTATKIEGRQKRG